MHELGVVFHIADSVEKVARDNGAEKVHCVTLEIGEVSTVIPHYLVDVWTWHSRRVPLLEGCELKVEQIPAVTHCPDCGTDYPTVPQGITCPRCGSRNTYLLTGNEVNIKEIAIT